MKSKSIKYIIAFFFCSLFILKGAMPLLVAAVTDKDSIEMVSEIEPEESKKPARPLAETEIQELYTAYNFTDFNGYEMQSSVIIPSWQNTVYKQKVFIAIPTPPPKQA